MKKALLTLVAVATTLSASAIARPGLASQRTHGTPGMFIEQRVDQTIEVGPGAMMAPSRAETPSMEYCLAADPYTALGFNNQYAGLQVAQAFEFTATDATKYAGNDLTEISYYTGINETTGNNNNITACTVFLTYDLQAEPFYSQYYDQVPNTRFTKVTVPLKTPYTIEAGKAFYVGVKYTLAHADDIMLVVDYTSHSGDEGGWYAAADAGVAQSAFQWDNIAPYGYGFIWTAATLCGNNLPTNFVDVTLTDNVPIAETGSQFGFYALLENAASNEITSVEYTIQVGTQEAKVYTTEGIENFGYKKQAIIGAEDLSYDVASKDPIDIVLTVTKVNGVPNNSESNVGTGTITIIPAGAGYSRNIVVEEATGTWCGYCPIGITAMETIRETYPDGEVIPVAVHGPSANDDPMYSSTYAKVFNALYSSQGVPSCMLNRTLVAFPDMSELADALQYMQSYPAIATVNATAAFTDDTKAKVQIDSKFAFTFDDDSSRSIYRLAFGVTEDQVGPYNQTNYYSGAPYDYYGWENLGETVSVTYNDVARQLNSYAGILNTIPGTVVAGKEYEHSYTLTLSGVSNKDNINIIVYIMDTKTGEVVNACTIKTRDIQGGVADMIVDTNDAPVEYFNLQGIRVANPAEGQIYIRRQGTQATKVLF
ncbi:MAG: Omp28-related outer membrane protein [Muribaculaceae bacterium]